MNIPRPVLLALPVVFASLAHRVWLVRANHFPTYDGALYLRNAWRLYQDGVVEYGNFPPGWPLLVGLFAPLFGGYEPEVILQTAEILNLLFSVAVAVLLFLIARRWLDPAWALLVATVFFCLPETVEASFSDLSDMSYLAFVLGGLALVHRGRPLAAGLGLGWAFVIRPEAVMVVAALVTILLFTDRSRLPGLIGGYLIPFLGYQAFGWAGEGTWVGSSKSGWLLGVLRHNDAAGVLRHYVENARLLLGFLGDMVGFPLFLLALWGLLRRPGTWAVLLVLAPVLPLFGFRMDPRYLLPAVAGICLAAGLASAHLMSTLRWKRTTAWGLIGLWAMSLGMSVPVAYRALRVNAENYPTMRDAGAYLRTVAEPDAVVAGRKPYVAFWAKLPFRRLPETSMARDLARWLRETDVRFVTAHLSIAGATRPKLRALAHPSTGDPATLRELRRFEVEGNRAQTLYLYEVLPQDQR